MSTLDLKVGDKVHTPCRPGKRRIETCALKDAADEGWESREDLEKKDAR